MTVFIFLNNDPIRFIFEFGCYIILVFYSLPSSIHYVFIFIFSIALTFLRTLKQVIFWMFHILGDQLFPYDTI